ncbi:uncharacterized protein LOC121530063 [Drosophila eugracilis]|uniref:uncharacterized protein LOC121530063 n=1 Tax=Drosophila eugracilis TaxID=29029 RepID=UPI001BDA324D|nr:uncharacterized protein LOC121530063 [Drosophila eugracilis]
MYVDDLLTGADLKAAEVTSILSKAGLELEKWNTSNIEGNGEEFQFKIDTTDRFVSRRGIPLRIYGDNATNFVGARSQLEDFKQQLFDEANTLNVQKFSSIVVFEFKFIPPRASHFGGLWEAAVKSMKSQMMKNLGNTGLTYEELQTTAIESEAILNSRPMAPLSEDPNDGEALSTGQLLIGSSLMSAQSKWLKPNANIQIGLMVIIHEDNTPPQEWILGRITNTHVGADGRVKAAEIKVKNGTI